MAFRDISPYLNHTLLVFMEAHKKLSLIALAEAKLFKGSKLFSLDYELLSTAIDESEF